MQQAGIEESGQSVLDDYLEAADRILDARGFERRERYEKRSFEPSLARVFHFSRDARGGAMVGGRNVVLHDYHEAWISITPFASDELNPETLYWHVERIAGLMFSHVNRAPRHAGTAVANVIVVAAGLDDVLRVPGKLPDNLVELASSLGVRSRLIKMTRLSSLTAFASLFIRLGTRHYAPVQSPAYVHTLPVLAVVDTAHYFYPRKTGWWPVDSYGSTKELADANIGAILGSYEQRKQWIAERNRVRRET